MRRGGIGGGFPEEGKIVEFIGIRDGRKARGRILGAKRKRIGSERRRKKVRRNGEENIEERI